MKIKNQFLISIVVFSIVLAIIVASVVVTEQQTSQLNGKEATARDIQNRASDLNYISNDYFLYQSNADISLWQTQLSALTTDLTKLNSTNPQQMALVNNVNGDLQNLNDVFNGAVSFLENAPRNESVRVLPGFQTEWSRLAVQNQALTFDAQQLSQNLRSQVDQSNFSNIFLIVAFLGLFGAFFITNYLITYRNTLKSISELQDGIGVIGSGNLDYSLKDDVKDEVGEIARAVNQMRANLKTVTASKVDLEKEIADRKKIEQMLAKSEERWSTTLSSIGDSVIATDLSGNVTFMNIISEQLTGWTLSEAFGKSLKDVFHIINEETRQQVENPVAKVLERGMIVGLANHTILVRRDGSEVPLDDSGAPIKDENGNVTGVVLVFHDISERKEMERKLEDYNKNLQNLVEERTKKLELTALYARNLIEASLDPLVTINREGKITDVNKATEDVTGCSREELVGSDFSDYFTEPEQARAGYQKVFTEGFVKDYPLSIRHKSGKTTDVLYNASVYRNSQGEMQGVFAAARDITERKQAEQKLKDAERLANIGATAGMVGHDIRNPLQAITGDVYLAKTELSSIPESAEKKNIEESLTEIEKNIEYINKIVQDLQDYARPLNPQPEKADLKPIIEKLLAKNDLPKNVKVRVKVDDEVNKISADSYYINRIMYNLVTNAVQAMPKGGKLTIHAYKEANDVVIAVADTGVGIPTEIAGKLFTPMFTTKSKGQGFGLPVVKRMTESLGGSVSFESQEGKGTTFMVRLPLSKN